MFHVKHRVNSLLLLREEKEVLHPYGIGKIGDRRGEASALWNSAVALNALGQHTESIGRAEEALVIDELIESPYAEQVRNRLAEWRKSR